MLIASPIQGSSLQCLASPRTSYTYPARSNSATAAGLPRLVAVDLSFTLLPPPPSSSQGTSCPMLMVLRTSPRLPIEVIERVIDSVFDIYYLGTITRFREQCAIWKACAVTCRAMFPRSQYWLYRDIFLSSQSQAEKLARVLRSKPAVAKYVRSLRLWGPRSNKALTLYNWISWTPLLFLPLTKSLDQIILGNNTFAGCHPSLPTAISAFRSIHTLRLFNILFPSFGHCTRLIRSFPHLSCLQLYNASWAPDPDPNELHSPRRNRRRAGEKGLKFAHLDLVGDDLSVQRFATWLSDMGTANLLRTLSGSVRQFDIMHRAMFSRESQVQSLFMDSDADQSLQALTSDTYGNLQSVHLNMLNSIYPVQIIASIVATMPKQFRMITIYIKSTPTDISAGSETSEEEISSPIDNGQLELDIDKALCTSLKQVRMTLCICASTGADEDEKERWRKLVSEKLPGFCAMENRFLVESSPSSDHFRRWSEYRDGFRATDPDCSTPCP